MTNEALSVFSNEQFGRIRLKVIEGREYFCGSDVAKALGYTNPRAALIRHCKYVTKRDALVQMNPSSDKLSPVSMSFIPEGDVYRLITHSKLTAAEAFERWVFDEVLPNFRQYDRQGELLEKALSSPDFLIQLANELKWAQQARVEAMDALEASQKKVLFADAICASSDAIVIGDLAKLLKQNGVEIGTNRLFDWLREKHYFILNFLREDAMKKRELSDFTMRLIRENEAAIKVRSLYVAKTQQEIEAIKKQNRELMGRGSHVSQTITVNALNTKEF